MFDLYNNVFKQARKESKFYQSIEDCRAEMLRNHNTIHVNDLGAGSKTNKSNIRAISAITKTTSKQKKYNRFLAQLAQYMGAKSIVELGTSVGISTMYLALQNKEATIYTVEGCENIAAFAVKNFERNNLQNIQVIKGNFDNVLPELLEKKGIDFWYIDGNHTYAATKRYFEWIKKSVGNNTVMVFDDIYWNEEMAKAWHEIINDTSVTASVDMFEFGVVFFKHELSKQHFVLRY